MGRCDVDYVDVRVFDEFSVGAVGSCGAGGLDLLDEGFCARL